MELQAIKEAVAGFNAEQAREDGVPEFLIKAVLAKIARENKGAGEWHKITALPPMATAAAIEIADRYVRDNKAVKFARIVSNGRVVYLTHRHALDTPFAPVGLTYKVG